MAKLESLVSQLRLERDCLNKAIAVLESMNGHWGRTAPHRISVAGRVRIAAAQRKRWAAFKAKKKR